jgi:aerobic-type carbon monoxide dehydrogenase small subunit (CoxS/CutS family)
MVRKKHDNPRGREHNVRSSMEKTITFTVNGQSKTLTTEAERPLLEVLREDLQLTGTKCGCGEGKCGACTVLINGRNVVTCITPVGNVQGQTITTIEGLATGDKLHPVQEAFLAEGAMQCGYCTPGMMLAVVALLNERPHPTDAEILSRMEGHICRCCGYTKILKAIKRAAAAGR